MYQKLYTCTEINILLHFCDLRALILQYNNVRGPTFPEKLKALVFNRTILLSFSNSLMHQSINQSIIIAYVSAPTKPIFSANQRFVGARANTFWQYGKLSFGKVNKFVEI